MDYRYVSPLPFIIVMIICAGNQVFATYINVALNKPTRESSTANKGFAVSGPFLATDGLTNDSSLCTLTEPWAHSWWRVDLLNTYQILQIVIQNANFIYPEQYLSNFYVYVSNQDPYPDAPFANGDQFGELCHYRSTYIPASIGLYILPCATTLTGRYVTVHKPDDKSLQICEFQVMTADGIPVMTSNSNSTKFGYSFHNLQRRRRVTALTTFYTETLTRPSPVLCGIVCVSACVGCTNDDDLGQGHVPMVVQLNTESGMCECVSKTIGDDFYSHDFQMADDSWITMEMQN